MPLIGRIAIAFVVTTCYPMQLHPGRGSLLSLLGALAPKSCIRTPPPIERAPMRPTSRGRHGVSLPIEPRAVAQHR